jgi:hypothetical protein
MALSALPSAREKLIGLLTLGTVTNRKDHTAWVGSSKRFPFPLRTWNVAPIMSPIGPTAARITSAFLIGRLLLHTTSHPFVDPMMPRSTTRFILGGPNHPTAWEVNSPNFKSMILHSLVLWA